MKKPLLCKLGLHKVEPVLFWAMKMCLDGGMWTITQSCKRLGCGKLWGFKHNEEWHA